MNNLLDNFGTNCFSEKNLKNRVPDYVVKKFLEIKNGKAELTLEIADIIANAIKMWALEKGATHYTHWFQPLTDLTAEKHESFISINSDGTNMAKFSGKDLMKGESDTSSFPNGGLRSTFEARGYTAWDISSPMFLKGEEGCKTLYIPTAFIAYNGEALDKKVPLLRSINSIKEQALKIQKLLGDNETENINVTLGVEQEYFLVDKKFFYKRQDLVLSGKTVFGCLPPKGQQMNDHYYGMIKERIENFMAELDNELWKVGVMSKTKHNEVAPNQFEIALMFSTANVSVDQNQITMDMIKKVANRHNMVALLHEKPFQGVNGSGKHCNWSLSTDKGVNLYDPETLTENNLSFLVYLLAMIEGVDRYASALRATTATPGNDYRLGGHEAPPAIISIFLGDQLENILENIESVNFNNNSSSHPSEITVDKNISRIPKDISDRNRTSPMAFTGNKFEFRMPGSSSTPATSAAVINAMVGKVLSEYADKLEKATEKSFPKVVNDIIANAYKKHHRIIFNGNGYSEEWAKEAKKRGLTNEVASNTALRKMIDKDVLELTQEIGMLSEQESVARYNAYADRYVTQLSIESRTLIDIANKNILPSGLKYANLLADYIEKNSKYGKAFIKEQEEILKDVLANITSLRKEVKSLEKEINRVRNEKDLGKQTDLAKEKLVTGLEALRVPCDNLEKIIDKEYWNFPTFSDLLFKL